MIYAASNPEDELQHVQHHHWLDPHFADRDTEPRSEASLGPETPGLAPGGPGGLILKLLPVSPVRT